MSRCRHALFLTVILSSFVVADAGGATNMYLKFEEPGIQGNSTAPGHEKEIELLSWSYGFGQPTSPTRSTSGSGTVEQATHQNFTFTKYMDDATDELLKYCWSGRQIGKATVTCYRSDGAVDHKPVQYLQITMEHVVISNFSISGGAGDLPVENVSLDSGVVKYVYDGQKSVSPKTVPQSMTATPSLRTAASHASCSVKLPGEGGALQAQSWNLTQSPGGASGLTFSMRADTKATTAIAAYQKEAAGGSVTLTCGTGAALTLTNAKISRVSKAGGLTNVTVTYGAVE